MERSELTQDLLKSLLDYDPSTGVFSWKVTNTTRSCIKGRRAGYEGKDGYRNIKIMGVKYREHILACLYMKGQLPKESVDHIDQVRSNNTWSNLREVTHAENCLNKGATRKSKTGHQGVWYNRDTFNYLAYIHKGKRRVWQKYFPTCAEAVEARKAKLLEFGFHPNHGKEV